MPLTTVAWWMFCSEEAADAQAHAIIEAVAACEAPQLFTRVQEYFRHLDQSPNWQDATWLWRVNVLDNERAGRIGGFPATCYDQAHQPDYAAYFIVPRLTVDNPCSCAVITDIAE